ncbi:hypothetical protein [Microcoleus sp. bin38.metabat.b11b12b14.051]|uniref:hypothetical protein n=1 Tax=Microcoleus sp. bin38.metabat.b11b12b14.051 TaxID=2742709 RepID=UPI0025F01B3D|nr:hypothetical protein [Microcoleus sp. bin38.metabat.b11b12b14.051]
MANSRHHKQKEEGRRKKEEGRRKKEEGCRVRISHLIPDITAQNIRQYRKNCSLFLKLSAFICVDLRLISKLKIYGILSIIEKARKKNGYRLIGRFI